MKPLGTGLGSSGATVVAAFALAAGMLVETRAESDTVPTLETCAEIQSESERLACYDTVLRERDRAGDDQRPPARGADAAPPSASRAAQAAPPPAQQAPPGESEERAVTVVEVRLRTPLPSVFRMENGEAWIQTDSRNIPHLQDTPFPAHIQPGALGSYFLSPDNGGPRVRVRRLE